MLLWGPPTFRKPCTPYSHSVQPGLSTTSACIREREKRFHHEERIYHFEYNIQTHFPGSDSDLQMFPIGRSCRVWAGASSRAFSGTPDKGLGSAMRVREFRAHKMNVQVLVVGKNLLWYEIPFPQAICISMHSLYARVARQCFAVLELLVILVSAWFDVHHPQLSTWRLSFGVSKILDARRVDWINIKRLPNWTCAILAVFWPSWPINGNMSRHHCEVGNRGRDSDELLRSREFVHVCIVVQ